MNSVIESDCREILSRVDFKKIQGKKILVTGATGFLGQYVVAALSLANREGKLGASIHAVGLSEPQDAFAELLKQDGDIIFTRVDLSQAFELGGYDFIFHAAGYGQPAKFINDPSSLVRINVDATVRLLETSPKSTFVYFSSAEVYGDIPSERIPVTEDFNGNVMLHSPRSVYAEAKRLGEALCAAYKKKNATDVRIVRISHVYGPGLSKTDTRVMSEFIHKASQEKEITLLDEGRAVKTYGYIADVISMIFTAAFNGQEMVYNVGGEDSVSIFELAQKIAAYFKVPCKTTATASTLSHIGKDPGIVKLDLTKIKKEMGGLQMTSFDEGLKRTIEWSL
jgi:dTDP-glucose 4,6-dehydratase/UDP-glucuronate decarboxylase